MRGDRVVVSLGAAAVGVRDPDAHAAEADREDLVLQPSLLVLMRP
jgi:hypothetical protein